jgi:hypothetical protein
MKTFLLTTICLTIALLASQAHTDSLKGIQCDIPSEIFSSQVSKPAFEQISQQTMCPAITNNCCTEKNYKAMNIWWQDDGTLSMVENWNEKINTIFATLTYRHKTISRLIDYARTLKNSSSSDVQCKDQAEQILALENSGALSQAYTSFIPNSAKCWQYNIDFLRGLACGVCEATSTAWKSRETFTLSKRECTAYADSCKHYWKNYYTLYNYISRFHTLATCKTGDNFSAKSSKSYFDSNYQSLTNECLKDSTSEFCDELCQTEMPFTGITTRELLSFPQ